MNQDPKNSKKAPDPKTPEQIKLEERLKEFETNPSKFAKRSCNRCHGRGIEGQKITIVTKMVDRINTATGPTNPKTTPTVKVPERSEVRTPYHCSCARRRFQVYLSQE